MKNGTLAWLALWSAAAIQPVQAANGPVVVEPTSAWTLDYGEERCSLMRSFGEGKNAVQLYIHSYGPFSGYRFLLSGDLVPRSRKATGEIRYRFNSDPAERERVPSIEGTFGERPAVSFSGAVAPYTPMEAFRRMTPEDIAAYAIRMLSEAPAFERQTESMTVEFDNRSRAELRLGNMAQPMQALRTCAEDLQRHWGLDPAKLQQQTRIAVPVPASIRRVQRSYPTSQVLGGASAFVPVRIMVDAQGDATQCVVQVPNIEDDFTRAVCNGLAHKFEPALDVAGQPTASLYQTSVVYLRSR